MPDVDVLDIPTSSDDDIILSRDGILLHDLFCVALTMILLLQNVDLTILGVVSGADPWGHPLRPLRPGVLLHNNYGLFG
jgi:hypothetical protein